MQDLYLNGLIRSSTPELADYRQRFEDNYDNKEYLLKLADEVAVYAKENQIADAYILLNEIDERIFMKLYIQTSLLNVELYTFHTSARLSTTT